MKRLYLSTAYWAPVSYYSALLRHGGAVIDLNEAYIKQTYRNRCHIVGASGVLPLTVPVVKPLNPAAPVRDVRISEHGNWRHLHRVAIASAYGSSPFYEYYADDINSFYDNRYEFLADYNLAQTECVRKWLNIDWDIQCSDVCLATKLQDMMDLRAAIHPKHPDAEKVAPYIPAPYYQVFANRHGFIADASILDLVCNMGNESLLILSGKRQ